MFYIKQSRIIRLKAACILFTNPRPDDIIGLFLPAGIGMAMPQSAEWISSRRSMRKTIRLSPEVIEQIAADEAAERPTRAGMEERADENDP